MNLYFGNNAASAESGFAFELRAQLAWEMLKTNGILSGTTAGEDSAGRQAFAPMPPQELVDRALEIAERFVKAAEERNYLCLPEMTLEQIAAERGRLQYIESKARFPQKVDAA